MTDDERETLAKYIETWSKPVPDFHVSHDGFYRVYLYSNWCNLDYWNGAEVRQGQYTAKWPNGTETVETVMVKRWIEDRHQRDGDIPYSEAYILSDYRGQTVKVPVRGLLMRS